MSAPKKQKRHITAAYAEAQAIYGTDKFKLVVHGRTLNNKNDVDIVIDAEWYFINHFCEEMKKAWVKEKARREQEIRTLDSTLSGVLT